MPKFLFVSSYTADGLKGLQKDKASGRLAAATQAVQSLGGSLDSLHFALGAEDVVIIADLPDAGAAAALSTAVSASGLARIRTTALLTVPEMDAALGKSTTYRGPGQ
jgi:uncharacterized protein with GYD domain